MVKKYLFCIHVNLLNCCAPLVCGGNLSNRELYLKSVEPSSVTILERNPVTAYCGSLSPVNWTYSSARRPLSGEDVVDIAVHSRHLLDGIKITLIDLLENDTGNYCCLGRYRSSNFRACLLVQVSKYAPVGSIVPTITEVSVGGSVTLSCGSTHPVEWFGLHNQNLNNITIRRNSITLHNLKKEHSGPYVCRGTKQFTTLSAGQTLGRFTSSVGLTFHRTALIFVDIVVELVYSLKPDNSTVFSELQRFRELEQWLEFFPGR